MAKTAGDFAGRISRSTLYIKVREWELMQGKK